MFTYDDIVQTRWILRATVYERSMRDDTLTIIERGCVDVGTYASYSMARETQYQRSAHDEIRSAYGTYGMENLIVTFTIVPATIGAYPNQTVYTVDN
jgi:hypothetical protein